MKVFSLIILCHATEVFGFKSNEFVEHGRDFFMKLAQNATTENIKLIINELLPEHVPFCRLFNCGWVSYQYYL